MNCQDVENLSFPPAVLPARFAVLNSGEQPPEMGGVPLAELGMQQMELWTLSQLAALPELGDLATYPTRFLDETYPDQVFLSSS